MNADLDVLIDRYFATIPGPDRVDVIGQIVYPIADQVVPIPAFYDANAVLISDGVRNVMAKNGRSSTEVWHVETWDVNSRCRAGEHKCSQLVRPSSRGAAICNRKLLRTPVTRSRPST